MLVCPSCGHENPEGARFCNACAAPLTGPEAVEQRKTVTVLFCDVTGSTALGERLDPESLRRVLARYFGVARDAVGRHGGVVEKFIGDAVMAVFGIPQVHEDDALRGVRAAVELRTELELLNEELERDYGTMLTLRMGVNTGEVVTGTEERLATGDAVNVAARLEQAADPGEVLLGPETLRLVHESVTVEELPPLELRGKAESFNAYRLLALDTTQPVRRHAVEMVGRDRQLKLLRDAFENVAAERSCHLFTVLGSAGVGKSRLVFEFLRTLDDASVLRGRCLSYGEGITYWPVIEIVKQAGGSELLADEAARHALEGVLGEAAIAGRPDEIAWAFRKLLEMKAAEQPLVCMFDDIQWGEDTFLDLVEHIADLSRGAPILLLCMARPELLDRRASWAGGKLNATSVLLEPLSEHETDELIGRLLAGSPLGEALQARIRRAAGGNPLFVEEMLALVGQSSNGDAVPVPPTIQALLAARLDQLDARERHVLERGSVEGEVFHRGAVAALVQDGAPLDDRLAALVRKDLLRPERPQLSGEDGYRFRHLLIRDAAYEALPKASRAELHERFALWLEERGATLVEFDEIAGYHLEQAYRYRHELGPLTDADTTRAMRAAELLTRAGRRALDRNDRRAAVNLLERASQLFPHADPGRVRALLDLGRCIAESGEDFQRSAVVLERAREDAETLGRADLQIRTQLELANLASLANLAESEPNVPESLARDAILVLEREGDEEGLARAWFIAAVAGWRLSRWDDLRDPLRRSIEHARRAGNRSMELEAQTFLLAAAAFGSTPVHEAIRLARQVLAGASDSLELQGSATRFLGFFVALHGRVEEGRELLEQARRIFTELGHKMSLAVLAFSTGALARSVGDAAAAEQEYRAALTLLQQIGERGRVTNLAAGLADALIDQGRLDEAQEYADLARDSLVKEDASGDAVSRMATARLLVRRGAAVEAVELACEAVEFHQTTQEALEIPALLIGQADVLRLAGREVEAIAALRTAIDAAERKGTILEARRAQAQLAEIEDAARANRSISA